MTRDLPQSPVGGRYVLAPIAGGAASKWKIGSKMNRTQAAIDAHRAHLATLAIPGVTPEQVEIVTRDAVATYDLMNYSAEVCDLDGPKMRELDGLNRQVHAALKAFA